MLIDIRDETKARIGVTFTHGAIGTDSTTPIASDTTLGAEVFRDTIDEFDDSQSDTVVTSLRVLTTEANGNTIRESGWFDDPSAGTMWTRNILTEIIKTNDIQIFLDVSIQIQVTETT